MTTGEHLAKARQNEQFAASITLNSQTAIDWAITVKFYVAVHYVQAYFSTPGRTFRAHAARGSAIERDPNIRIVYDDYRELEDLSRQARYELLAGFQVNDLVDANDNLTRIKSQIHVAMGL